jgi:uncharacterized damage-inducible protein DinB
MTRVEKLSNEVFRSVFGDPWHGVSVSEILKDIPVSAAIQKPAPGAHSIIELVLHLTAWTEEVLSRFNGNPPAEPSRGDWPNPEKSTDEYWESVKNALYESSKKLMEAVLNSPDGLLDSPAEAERVPALGTGFTPEELIYGVVQHNAYHMGQISLLNKYFAGGN